MGHQHVGLPAKNLQETLEFYKGLGFEVAWQSANGRCVFLKLKNVMFETFEVGDRAAMAYGAIDHLALDVTDAEAAYQIALDKGYKVVSKGLETLPFWENGVKFFTIEGPNKEKIEFNQYL